MKPLMSRENAGSFATAVKSPIKRIKGKEAAGIKDFGAPRAKITLCRVDQPGGQRPGRRVRARRPAWRSFPVSWQSSNGCADSTGKSGPNPACTNAHDPPVSFGDDQAGRLEVDRSQGMGVQFVHS